MIKKFTFYLFTLICCCIYCGAAFSQLTISTSVVHAACPNSGRITVNISGGNPNYTYSITSPTGCLPAAVPPTVLPATSYTFLNLAGACTYRITVTDINGLSATRTVTVQNFYAAMNTPTLTANIFSSLSCSYLKAVSSGGAAPFVYTFYSGASATNAAAIIQSGSSDILQLATYGLGTYTVKIRDNCGTERIKSVTTPPIVFPTIVFGRTWRPACNEFRINFIPDDFPAGITLDILDRNGNHISGTTSATGINYAYPYTIPDTVFSLNHPWGQSNITPVDGGFINDLPVPNNPALFPLTLKIKDNSSCNYPVISMAVPYPFPAASTAFITPPIFYTENCNGTLCGTFNMQRSSQVLENYNYPISYATVAAGPFTSLGNTVANLKMICALQPSSNYYIKISDPCTLRDSVVQFTTPPLQSFGVTGGIISYCLNPASSNYFATAFFTFPGVQAATGIQIISGPGGPRTVNGPLLQALVPGNYVLQFTDLCGTHTQTVNLNVGGTYNTSYTTGTVFEQTCADNCLVVNARGTASGTLVPNGLIPNFFTTIKTLPGNVFIEDSLHTGIYRVCGLPPGTYAVATAPFYAGITCVIPTVDTIVIPAYALPVVDKVYDVRCAPVNNIIVPLPQGPDSLFVYSLYNSSSLLIAGPQSLHGNSASTPVTNAVNPPNVFSGIAGSPGDAFFVKIQDACGNSAISPVTLPNDILITGAVTCGLQYGGSYYTDSLKADYIPGALYTWISPSGVVYGPSGTPNYGDATAENGVWHLNAAVTFNGCTSTFSNNFPVSCAVVPLEYNNMIVRAKTCGITAQWTTTSEQNTDHFDILLSDAPGRNETVMMQLPAAGFSNVIKNYSASLPMPEGNWYVRIRQYDADGFYTDSKYFAVKVSCTDAVILNIYPKPVSANDHFTIELNYRSKPADVKALLYDATGRIVLSQSFRLISGANRFMMNTTGLSRGTYFLKLSTDTGNSLCPATPIIIN